MKWAPAVFAVVFLAGHASANPSDNTHWYGSGEMDYKSGAGGTGYRSASFSFRYTLSACNGKIFFGAYLVSEVQFSDTYFLDGKSYPVIDGLEPTVRDQGDVVGRFVTVDGRVVGSFKQTSGTGYADLSGCTGHSEPIAELDRSLRDADGYTVQRFFQSLRIELDENPPFRNLPLESALKHPKRTDGDAAPKPGAIVLSSGDDSSSGGDSGSNDHSSGDASHSSSTSSSSSESSTTETHEHSNAELAAYAHEMEGDKWMAMGESSWPNAYDEYTKAQSLYYSPSVQAKLDQIRPTVAAAVGEKAMAAAAAGAAVAISDELDRRGIWAQHGIILARDGISSDPDAQGTPAATSTLLAMNFCRVWGAQIGFGYGSTARSESTIYGSDYRTAGKVAFYDKGAFLHSAFGFCVPTKYVQPYLMAGFDLPIGGERTALTPEWTLSDGDISGARLHAIGGINFRFPKIPIGVGVLVSYTHVFPRTTLVDATDGTGSTWGAEGGGAGYWTLGVQGIFYPFH